MAKTITHREYDLFPIGIGTWGIGGFMERDISIDEGKQVDAIAYMLDKGMNFMEVNMWYSGGYSVEILSKAFKQSGKKRSDIVICQAIYLKDGIISDVHDNLRMLDKAIQFFNSKNIEILLHCGDWDMPFTLRMYEELNCPVKGITGNGDPDIEKFQYALRFKLPQLQDKINIKFRFQDLKLDGKRIGIIHGDDDDLTNALLESQLYDVLCLGHTHKAKIERHTKTLLINPGSLVGVYLLQTKHDLISVALYDTQTDTAELVDLEKL